MVTLPVPDEIVLVLLLLPGYVLVRVGIHFARYAGPIDWAEYERVALSLVGSVALLAGVSAAYPSVATIKTSNGGVVVVTDVTLSGYVTVFVGALFTGIVLGHGVFVLFGRLGASWTPKTFLLQRLEAPIMTRVVTHEREIVGRMLISDEEGNPAVLSRPRLVTSQNGTKYRKPMGRYVYIDPETIEHVFFGSELLPEAERAGGGLVHRVWRDPLHVWESLRSIFEFRGNWDETEPWGPLVTPTEEPLHREADRVRARGTLQNESSEEIQFVQVQVEFENEDGTVIGTGVDSFERLGANDAWRFDVEYATDEADSVASFSFRWYAQPPI